jgi:hypothetical protein
VLNLVTSLPIRGQPSSLLYVEMLKSGTTDYQILRCGKVDEPQTVVCRVSMEAKPPDCLSEDSFSSDLFIKIANLQFLCCDQH